MLANMWERVQLWYDNKIESTAVKRLNNSVNGRAIKNAIPPILVFIIVGAVLIAHLSTLRWPESFSGFLLASPIIAVLLLSLLTIVTCPSVTRNVPLYACGGYVALVAIQCMLGALAMSLPAFVSNTGNPGHRMIFSAVTVLILTLILYNLSKSFVKRTSKGFETKKPTKPKEPVEETEETDYLSSASGD